MEDLIDIGKPIIEDKHGFHIQSRLSKKNELIILLLQDYCGKISQYRLCFGEILYYEFIDEHISAPRFLDRKVFDGVVFKVEESSLLSEIERANVSELHHYFIRSDLYYIDIISVDEIKIEKININMDIGYIL